MINSTGLTYQDMSAGQLLIQTVRLCHQRTTDN